MVTELPNLKMVRTCNTCRYFKRNGEFNSMCKVAVKADPANPLLPTHHDFVCDAHSYKSPFKLAKLKATYGVSDDQYMDFA